MDTAFNIEVTEKICHWFIIQASANLKKGVEFLVEDFAFTQ